MFNSVTRCCSQRPLEKVNALQSMLFGDVTANDKKHHKQQDLLSGTVLEKKAVLKEGQSLIRMVFHWP